jgi:glycosyltransferase involved in cell wall biosynthesis
MKIGIYSKFDMAGGSEFRCVEMANGIVTYTEHEVVILSERNFPKELSDKTKSNVKITRNCWNDVNNFYNLDCLLVVNSDSKSFTTINYWENLKEGTKTATLDLSKMKKMVFIFNFLISPSKHLYDIYKKGVDVRIICGNGRFYRELSSNDKYEKVRILPRMILESPIDLTSVDQDKTKSSIIRIGKHSKPMGSKWNSEHKELIEKINAKHGHKIIWDFMGGSKEFNNNLRKIPNVICREQFTVPVKQYLKNIDIFLFYPEWSRQECWARAVAEGLASGCPVLATDVDSGNREQVMHGSNGYLCKDVKDFENRLNMLIEDPVLLKTMGRNAKIYSRFFSTEYIIKKFINFIG